MKCKIINNHWEYDDYVVLSFYFFKKNPLSSPLKYSFTLFFMKMYSILPNDAMTPNPE